jgi:hypothetical protein
MISPSLYAFWPFFLLIFSPLETVDFLMLLLSKGYGYSLLCSKKQPQRHNTFDLADHTTDLVVKTSDLAAQCPHL